MLEEYGEFEDLTGHSIARGSLSNFQRKCSELLLPYEQEARRQLLKGVVLHADETVVRLNGKNQWVHVLSNSRVSFFAHHPKRGKEAMEDIGLLEKHKGTLVHEKLIHIFYYAVPVPYSFRRRRNFQRSHP